MKTIAFLSVNVNRIAGATWLLSNAPERSRIILTSHSGIAIVSIGHALIDVYVRNKNYKYAIIDI